MALKFKKYNKTKWTGIITGVITLIGAIAEAVFGFLDKL